MTEQTSPILTGEITELREHYPISSHHGGGHAYIVGITSDRIIKNEQVDMFRRDMNGLYVPESGPVFSSLETDVIRNEPPRLCLDCDALDFFSSCALGVLMTTNKYLRNRGERNLLYLVDLKPEIYELMAITRLNRLFNIKDFVNDFKAEYPSAD